MKGTDGKEGHMKQKKIKKVISFATQNKFYSTKFVLGHTFYNHISCSVITATFTNLTPVEIFQVSNYLWVITSVSISIIVWTNNPNEISYSFPLHYLLNSSLFQTNY